MWPNKIADGNNKTSTPGILSDNKELEMEESSTNNSNNNSEQQQQNINLNVAPQSAAAAASVDEFPILDELDRLAKVYNFYYEKNLLK